MDAAISLRNVTKSFGSQAVLRDISFDIPRGTVSEEMRTTDDPLIRQFFAGRAADPIGMDELATERTEVEKDLMDRERRRIEADGRDVHAYDLLTA